jgi:phage terminase small subunit
MLPRIYTGIDQKTEKEKQMKGPPPIPTEILKARGSWRAKKRANEPQAPVGAPDPPRFLDRAAREEWHRLVKLLVSLRVLTPADRAALAVLCCAWSDFCDRKRRRGESEKQFSLRLRNAADTLLQVGQQFGLTPASRTRVNAAPAPAEDDPMELLLRDHHGN